MKAAVFHACGDASQIKIEEVPDPHIRAGQALVRVHASAFNHLELWALHGPVDESYRFPMWTGSDIAGVIERLAPDVTGWSVGEAVVVNPSLSCGVCARCLEGEVSQCDDYDILGSAGNGGNAELVAVDAEKLMRMPAGFDFVKAAAAPLAYQTRAFRHLEQCLKPVVAAVNGFALGGGCELAMACHLRLASENAKFGQPEVKLGTCPGYGGTVRLPRLVGRGRAIELLTSGAMIDAQEAWRIGLVNRVVPADQLLAEAEKLVRTILEQGPLAVAMCLQMVDDQEHLPLDAALALESRRFGELAGTDDFREGTSAFLSKRKAAFQGQ